MDPQRQGTCGKLVLPSRKSLEIIINIKIIIQIYFFNTKNGGCPLIRACSLIRSNTVIKKIMKYIFFFHAGRMRVNRAGCKPVRARRKPVRA